MGINNSKEHYKMYKDGKRWVFASISIMTVMLTGAVHADSVHADTTNDASSEISNDDNATNELSQPQVVLDNKPVTKEENLPASEDKQITTENISASNKVEQDEQINDGSSNISSTSSNNEVTTVKTESNLNDADSQTSAATSNATSVNSSSAVSADSEVTATSSAASANSEVTATSSATNVNSSSAASADSEVTATSNATNVNSSSAASADSEVTATSSATSVNSSSAVSADSEVTATSDATGVNSEAVTANSSAVVSGSSSAAVTDAEIKKANTVPRTKAASQVISSVHVSSWNDFTSALKNKDINEIIIDNNIVASGSGSQSVAVRDNNTLLIRSNDGGRYAIDFRGAYPKGQLNLTYENIDLYGTVYYGVINTDVFLSSKQSNITFRNTSYTGAQLVYASDNTTVTFQGKNTIKAVSSYVSPVDGSIVSVSNSQQVLEFTGKNDYIIFDEGSIFEGSTFKDNVIRMTGNNSGITVKKGAIVTLTPHDNGTGKNGSAEWGNKANGIYMSGSGVLTVENGGTLNINAGEDSSQGVAAISITDKNTIMNINDGGTVNINVTGNISSYGGSGQSSNTAVYINGQLNTGYGASFNVNGHDMGSFSGTLVQISGNAKLLGSTFKIVLDDATSGTGSIVLLDTGGNVSIESPKDFLLHLGTNSQAQWIKDGSFSLSKARLKTNGATTGPFKTISFTVSGGNVLVTDADSKKIIGLTQADENKLISLLNQIGSDASVASLEFVQANGEVNIVDDNVTVTKENGKYLEVSGYTDTPGAYIHATINGNEFAGQKLDSPYWRENGIDTTVVYAAQASMTKDPNGKGYKFIFEIIPNDVINTLAPGTNIDLYATYNFLDSDVVSADLGILTAQQYRDKVNAAATDATSHINGLTHLTNQQKRA
ncbi:pectate lyase-like adhesive domain-containing protein [Weissella sagaensis]|uniref:Pectate lyase-like adhesive domain-containing protein n=1 Tax=Weissella sagaensis TaxID=2559928 RepID=A0ABW1RS25_9LACO|nr:KxYKxGKxW signal peptide domain-containing protein [Weissella sagaensis]